MNRLIKKLVYTGIIEVKTGLHIGGTNAALNIGGPDNFVVRNPIDNKPYIPGSSLKGKMRSLTELYNGETNNGNPSNSAQSKSGALFGVSGSEKESHPSRLIVRDAELLNGDQLENTDLPYTESKTEASINRITAKSIPRTFERVPAGAEFNLTMILNIFDSDNEEELKQTLKQAVSLLEDDYLGGSGSRGYGHVIFRNWEEPEEKTY
ncbi:MAG: type III-A CRISPR-associated RAMP protein Csm3 [Bacteroidales bacterium]|nr:type III-A CRISPR-associated RAMP protein Csm3 [Bacteroidales bacterium]MCM1147750.1 type III-A CRISPR-associated RAMP protein Csm3 [Bacteroidales bacterium]MCM1206640.1 type III-A CRISPR-associated RAMP protein Csm3 [Bacillota bacterium]MCM1510619.1 type III-A CRISPR-associated RAMP protein Csm3 [Clostridium sp.]